MCDGSTCASLKDQSLVTTYGLADVKEHLQELKESNSLDTFCKNTRISLRVANANFTAWGRSRSSGTCKCIKGKCQTAACSCFKVRVIFIRKIFHSCEKTK